MEQASFASLRGGVWRGTACFCGERRSCAFRLTGFSCVRQTRRDPRLTALFRAPRAGRRGRRTPSGRTPAAVSPPYRRHTNPRENRSAFPPPRSSDTPPAAARPAGPAGGSASGETDADHACTAGPPAAATGRAPRTATRTRPQPARRRSSPENAVGRTSAPPTARRAPPPRNAGGCTSTRRCWNDIGGTPTRRRSAATPPAP